MQYQLIDLVSKARRVLVSGMTPRRRQNLFGKDSRLASNICYAVNSTPITRAIEEGVIGDHRVIEDLRSLDEIAIRVILSVEARLGRKLPRSRAKKLAKLYSEQRRARLTEEAVVRMLKGIQASIKTEEKQHHGASAMQKLP